MPIFFPAVPNSWDFLGSKVITGSAAATTGNLTLIDPLTGAAGTRDELVVLIRVTGYSGTDVASLRFNADSGSNYWDRYVNFVANSTTVVNTENKSQTIIRMGVTTTKGRSDEVTISNLATSTKVCSVKTQIGSTSPPGTAGVVAFGGGEWNNTSAQITSIEMRTAGGSITMGVGSGFAVFGRNM